MSSTPARSQQMQAIAADMTQLSQHILNEAKTLGAEEAKVVASAGFETKLVCENKKFTLAQSLESQNFGILVHKDHKKGSASINTTDKAALTTSTRAALDLAKFSVPDQALNLSTSLIAPKASGLDFLFDAPTADMPIADLKDIMQEGLALLSKDKRVAVDRFEMSVTTTWGAMGNSHGVAQQEMQSNVSWVFMGMAVDGEQVSGIDYDHGSTYNRGDFKDRMHREIKSFVDRVVGNLNPQKAKAYKGLILLTPTAVQDILVGFIDYHMSGRTVMDGKSRWDKSIGEQVLSKGFTLVDTPHDSQFSGATSYDGDGVPTKNTTLIENGVLRLHVQDCYSARRNNTKTTGHSGGPFCPSIAAGTVSKSELCGAAPNLLMVHRFSGNTDALTGDFSGVAKSSRLFKNGQLQGSVGETMIAGNFFEVARMIAGISKEREMVGGSFLAPYILLDGVSVS